MQKNVKYGVFILCFLFCVINTQAQTDSTTSPASINDDEVDSLDIRSNTLPVFNATGGDVSGNVAAQVQGVNSLLGASRDLFIQSNIMHFITARFRYRGYNTNNMLVMMNGVRINSLETGVASFSAFGGMNDVIRYMDQKTGLGASRFGFGDIAGYFNLNIFASTFRKGLRITYSQGNRIFKERLTLTYSTGLTKKGWAFSVSASGRYAERGYVPGTAFQGLGLFVGADKKFSEKNTLSLVGFWAPIIQQRQSMETDEAYGLMNNFTPKYSVGQQLSNTLFGSNVSANNHYNSYWGYQNGQIRSARTSKISTPTVILTDLWKITPKSNLTASIYGSQGRNTLTYLNYYGVPNPAPDYYKYMPSYYGPTSDNANPYLYNALTQAWQTGGINPLTGLQVGQIDWDGMYRINQNNVQTVANVDGIPGKTYTGKRAAYIVEERRQDITTGGFNAIYNTELKNEIHLTGGINAAISNTRYYKVVNDLLGGDYWLDLNQLANSVSTGSNTIQNNINNPNKIIRQGDVFGYDYNINVNREELWGQVEKSFKRFDVYASATFNHTSFYRKGNMENGLFPYSSSDYGLPAGQSTSLGKSTTLNFWNYGVKAGITYKINGHNYITLNGACISKPPLPTNAFISPSSRNDVIPGMNNEQIFTGDITYNVRLSWLKGRITYYITQINNQTWLRSYFDDDYKTNINYFMTDMNQLNQGVELGLEGVINPKISILGALAYGQYLYTNRPTATISADNTAQLLESGRTVYLKNYHVGGTPELASSLGVRYNATKKWYIGAYFNYFANNYVTINPDRRTAEAVAKYISTDPQVNQILNQEKLPNAYTIDLLMGKSFQLKNKYYLSFNLMINNITNNIFKNFGEEQLRHNINIINEFPNKYSYTMGLTYQLTTSFSF
ncbi:MAG: hypothetical protein JST67_00835 [Bacteroidetes bacterium]|nr:hypothetical protein [Bacteroidota bacterium]